MNSPATGSQVDPPAPMTDERIAQLRGILGPNRPGQPGSCGIERGIAHEALNTIERLLAVVRPTRDQIAQFIAQAMYDSNPNATATRVPAFPIHFAVADALVERGWLAVSDSQETPG